MTAHLDALPHPYVLHLSDTDRHHLVRAAAVLADVAHAWDEEAFLLGAKELAAGLDPQTRRSVERFRQASNEFGTLLIRGAPLDELPATPPDGVGPDWPVLKQADTSLAVLMSLLGDPIGYEDEKEGRLIQDLAPIKGDERLQENSGSVFLEFHTENGFHPYPPDFIGLLCLRSDHQRMAATATAGIGRALPQLSSVAVDVLRQPLFTIRVSSSFRTSGNPERVRRAAPILVGDLQRPRLYADFHATQALTAEAAWALDHLREALESVVVGAVLAPGDLFIVDNQSAVHARTAFQPEWDGEDRWLRRMSVAIDIRRSRQARFPGRRVIAPLSLYANDLIDAALEQEMNA